MSKLIARGVRAGDIEVIAAGLRIADREEVHATVGDQPAIEVLRKGAESSSHLWVIEFNGVPAGLFGVVRAAEAVGVPWMLGTDLLERAPKQLTKQGRLYVNIMLSHYATLTNYVDARNLRSIYWLQRLGFRVNSVPEPFGKFDMPFYRFGMTR